MQLISANNRSLFLMLLRVFCNMSAKECERTRCLFVCQGDIFCLLKDQPSICMKLLCPSYSIDWDLSLRNSLKTRSERAEKRLNSTWASPISEAHWWGWGPARLFYLCPSGAVGPALAGTAWAKGFNEVFLSLRNVLSWFTDPAQRTLFRKNAVCPWRRLLDC